MKYLQLSIPSDQFFPPRTAFMARADLTETRLLGYQPLNQDAVTATLCGLMNGRPTVRHRSGVTAAILQTYERAGVHVDEDLHAYDTAAEADALAHRLIAMGYRLTAPYPTAEGRFPKGAMLVPNDLWRTLNDKTNLARIVPEGHVMARQIVALCDVPDLAAHGPVWIKAAGGLATGWGFAVRFCPDADARARAAADFAAMGGITHVIVEADADADHCWCASIVVRDDDTLFAGFAEQEFASPGRQAGSVIDPDHPIPAAAQSLAVDVGNAARAMGFRGIAGLDIGLARDGRLIVFDPNFRFNSSSAQALLHGSASRRAALPASRSCQVESALPMATLIDRATQAIDAGWFVPTRLLDASLLPAAAGQSRVTGFVLGADLADTRDRAAKFDAMLQS